VYRLMNAKGELIGADAITMRDEKEVTRIYDPQEILKSLPVKNYNTEALLHLVMENGKRTEESRSLLEIAEYSKQRLASLPMEFKRFDNPHIYKVGISKSLKKERENLLKKYKK